MSPLKTSVRPRRAGPTTAPGAIVDPSAAVHAHAALQLAEGGALGHAQAPRLVDVELPGPLVLAELPGHGRAAVVDAVRDQAVAVAGHLLAVAELARVQREAEPADDRREDREQVAEPGRPVQLEPLLAPAQVVGLEQPRAARARDRRGSG